jgi:hypothetical protein
MFECMHNIVRYNRLIVTRDIFVYKKHCMFIAKQSIAIYNKFIVSRDVGCSVVLSVK